MNKDFLFRVKGILSIDVDSHHYHSTSCFYWKCCIDTKKLSSQRAVYQSKLVVNLYLKNGFRVIANYYVKTIKTMQVRKVMYFT